MGYLNIFSSALDLGSQKKVIDGPHLRCCIMRRAMQSYRRCGKETVVERFCLCLNLRNSLSSRSWSSIWRPRYASCKFPPFLCIKLTTSFHLLVSVTGAVISYFKKSIPLKSSTHFTLDHGLSCDLRSLLVLVFSLFFLIKVNTRI